MVCPGCGEDTLIKGIATVNYEFELRYDEKNKGLELHDEGVVDFITDDMECYCTACDARFDESELLDAQEG